jgi:hypothetical protein
MQTVAQLFMGRMSVFVKLENSFELPISLLVTNMHILHNAAKHRQKFLSFDVEMSVIKAFNEFLFSAKELDQLKYFFVCLETEYSVHALTPVLCLFAAVARLLKNCSVITSYYLDQGEGNMSKAIWTFVTYKND